ncbi:ribonuclease HIII [Sutcliffiella rhizosphaerae]|uniref:Ribonuclease HIII n=1 Tax=Sutcliffiella rhizosphaerae TaxID=2880967 RepID=A0ABN8A7H6_9BACI|nr:ribonuclease HIII [Sutcliffiella rhizosphaerae]CAG9619572.1 Ribonuclease HIII [Sutcliffiella rhizosphaerae]
MSYQVLQVSTSILNKMEIFYKDHRLEKLPVGAIFAAKSPSCNITAYKSGKVLFQGKGADEEAKIWQEFGANTAPQKAKKAPTGTTKAHKTSLPEGFSSLSVIGSDEVGTGDYFGPITVCAAYVKKEQMAKLKDLGVQDSKALNDEKIIRIAKEIIPHIPYSLLVLHNEKYNEMQQKGMTQGKMKALLHNKALQHVLNKIAPDKPDAILIDQFAESGVYYRHIAQQQQIVRENVYFHTKAEGLHLSVAAASIIARYSFLQEMDKLSELAGITIPKGAGAKVDEAGAKVISKHGEAFLNQVAKVHFANTSKAKKLLR